MIEEQFAKSGLPISKEITEQFASVLSAYKRWQDRLNFTAIKDDESFVIKLFLGSIWPLYQLNTKDVVHVMDVGTGGGFPGLPMAVVRPDFRMVLNDAVKKKLDMVADICAHLSLSNVELLHERVENLGQHERHREFYDLVTAQALAAWPTALEYALPLVKVGGAFWAYQGPAIEKELSDCRVMHKLGGELEEVKTFDLPDDMGTRLLVVVRKTKKTPESYPRAVSVPKRKPLTSRDLVSE